MQQACPVFVEVLELNTLLKPKNRIAAHIEPVSSSLPGVAALILAAIGHGHSPLHLGISDATLDFSLLQSLVAEVLPEGATPLASLALFQSALPPLVTLQKLLELPLLAERSHQSFALLSGCGLVRIVPLPVGFHYALIRPRSLWQSLRHVGEPSVRLVARDGACSRYEVGVQLRSRRC